MSSLRRYDVTNESTSFISLANANLFLVFFCLLSCTFQLKGQGNDTASTGCYRVKFLHGIVNADIAISLVLSAASSSLELWLSVSDLHPRVQSAVRAFGFGRGGVAAGVDVTVARFKAAIRLASLGVEKIKQKFEVLPPCD